MDHIETAILNCYGIREAEQNMVFAARLTQHGHTIQNMADLMDLYHQSYSQKTVENIAGLPHRTIRSWEVEGRFPKQNVLYQKLADALQCDVSYLMSEDEAFITEASEQFGNRGAKQAQQILEQAGAMFAGGSLTDEDKIAFMDEIQSLYLDSKRRAKKFTPKKYLKKQEEK